MKAGTEATVVAASEVKRKRIRHEVRVDPFKTRRGYREDTSKRCLVDVFDNEVVDTDRSLIVVGSEATNVLRPHLGREGTFAYDKVLEKITPAYPGPGRGVLAPVECVNAPTYDPRSQSREAILVGGSEAAGTEAAVDRLMALIAGHCRAAQKPSTRGGQGVYSLA